MSDHGAGRTEPPTAKEVCFPMLPTAFRVALLAFLATCPLCLAQFGPAQVVVSPVVEREIPPTIRLVGTVRADRTAVLASEIAGAIRRVAIDDGQFVKAGDLIAELDDDPTKLKLEETAAQLASLQAALDELTAGERKEDVDRLAAFVAEADAIVKKWSYELDWRKGLFQQGQGNEKELHDTEMDYLAAQGRLAQARSQYERAKNGARPEEFARARQFIGAKHAQVRVLERELKKTKVHAPFAGFVVTRRVEVGEWVEVGGAICELISLEKVRVRVDVPESAVTFARPGAITNIEIEALGQIRTERVSRVIPMASPSARTFPVEIDLNNEDHAILPGMFVRANVPAGLSGKRLMASKDSIVAHGTNKQIFVIRKGEKDTLMALPMSVSTGLELGGLTEIIAPGLQVGDQVVTRGNDRLFGPTPVIIAPAESATSQPTSGEASAAETRKGGV